MICGIQCENRKIFTLDYWRSCTTFGLKGFYYCLLLMDLSLFILKWQNMIPWILKGTKWVIWSKYVTLPKL